jgi:hypothetical protein
MDLSMKDIALAVADWEIIEELKEFFLIFVKPSTKLQSSSYPTLNYAIPQYLKMIRKLQQRQKEAGEQSTIGQACTAALQKLDSYYTLATTQRYSHSNVATICDPRINHLVFDILLPRSPHEVRQNRAKQQFHDVFNKYQRREYDINTIRIEKESNLPALESKEQDSDDDLYVSHRIVVEQRRVGGRRVGTTMFRASPSSRCAYIS